MKKISLFTLLFIANFSFSQDIDNKLKNDLFFSYQQKLNNISSVIVVNYTEPDFNRGKTWDQVISANPDLIHAKNYFDALPTKVKFNLTVDELWYIYFNDTITKDILINIQ